MHQFNDAQGRPWEINIDVNAIRRVRSLTGVDLYRALDSEARGLSELLTDLPRFIDVLYVLCKPQADAASISDEDFGAGFCGDSLQLAVDTFVEELLDFFPSRPAAGLRKVVATGKALANKMLERAETAAQELDVINLDKVADEIVAALTKQPRTLSAASGNSPGNAASIPGASLSVP